MDSVLSNLQQQFTVGPLDLDQFHCNNDLGATDYSLIGEDEQLTQATAAAAAAIQIEQNKRREHKIAYRSRPSGRRLRALTGGRERVQEVIANVRERAPELFEKAQKACLEQEIIQATHTMARHIREQAPTIIHGIKEFVLELGKDPLEQPTYDCDAAGRIVGLETEYNNSLNEEEREAPESFLPYGSCQLQNSRHDVQSYQCKHDDEACRYVNIENGRGAKGIGGEPFNNGYANMNDPLDVKRHHSPSFQRQPPERQRTTKDGGVSQGPLHWGQDRTESTAMGEVSSAAVARASTRKRSKVDATSMANDDDPQMSDNLMHDRFDRSVAPRCGKIENLEGNGDSSAETLLDPQTASSELHEDFDT